ALMLAGFVLFRLFDIWKPWPVRWADRCVHGGLGVMLDDVLAGIYALFVLQLAALVLRHAHVFA
ncbi:MAG: phosphatidylglycerophosphatase A family protein, partial [Rhodanobacteraceae bacterium]